MTAKTTTDLQGFARQLHTWGASVTAIKHGTKRPAHKWERWQSYRQTRPELDGLPWRGAAAVGIVNGSGDFRVFDIDAVKDGDGRPVGPVPESVVIELLTALGLPNDYQWSYRSGSGKGFGVVIRCAEPLSPDWAAGKGVYVGRPADGRPFGQLELRWATGQTVIDGAHPTGPGYQWRRGERPFMAPAVRTAAQVVTAFKAIAEYVADSRPTTAASSPASHVNGSTSAAKGNLGPYPPTPVTENYAAAALADAIQHVSTAKPGDRNNTLFRQTADLAKLVSSRRLTRDEVEREMTGAALAAGLTADETSSTIASAFAKVGDSAWVPKATSGRPATNTSGPLRNGAMGQPTAVVGAADNGATGTGELPDYHAAGQPSGLVIDSSCSTTAGNLENVTHSSKYIAVLTALGYTFRLNELDDTVEVNGKPISDALRAKIFSQMGDRGFKGLGRIENVYIGHAYDNRYNPIKEYLNGLEWDGKDHIATLLNHLTFAENTEVAKVFFRRWLLGAVGKVLNQDQNFMLVLDGPQDTGKSYLARWLCPLPDHFVEGPIQPEDKDSVLRLMRNWIWEVGELQSTTRKADREALKHFITVKEPKVRKAYGRHDLKKPACASLIGTINESGTGFLDDRTGNRRFAVVNLQSINWDYTQAVDVHQLWAQVVAAYNSGERGTLSPAEKQDQSRINSGYGSLSSVEEYLWSYYEVDKSNTAWLPVRDILATLERNGLAGNQRANMMELAQILKAKEPAGVTKGRPNVDGLRAISYKGLRET